MLDSLIYILIFLLTYTLILIYPKTAARLNLVKQIFITFGIFICIIALPVFLLKIIGITISLNILSIVNGLISLVLFLKIKRTGCIQKFYLDKVDLINVLILTGLFIALFIHIFSIDLKLCYLNSDIANHFSMAYSFVEGDNSDVGIMYLTALINATIINIAKPLIEPLYYYKAFIVGDALINWFGWMMFYVTLTHFVRRNSAKRFHVLYSAFFFFGFPVYSYLVGGFVYWSLGVTLICFLLYILDIYSRNQIVRKKVEILTILSIVAIAMSYTLFVPCIFIASFFFFVSVLRKEGNLFRKESIFLFLKMYIVPALFIVVGLMLWFQRGQIDFESLKIDGGIYSNLYSDFWPLFPFVFYNLLGEKRKQQKCTQIFLVTFGVILAFMLACCHVGFISRYYYYKMYYPIWALMWIEGAIAIEDLLSKKEKFVICYIVMCIAVLGIQMTSIENKLVGKNSKMQIVDGSVSIFPIYQYMLPFIENGFAPRDDERLDIYRYVMDNLQASETEMQNIPCITSKDHQADCFWYSAITGNYSNGYFSLISKKGLSEEVMDKLETEVDYFVVFKSSELYMENIEKLQEYNIEYENTTGVIYKTQ